VARERVLALQAVEQRALLAADVGARAPAQPHAEREAAAADRTAEPPGPLRFLDRALQDRVGLRVLVAQVDEALVGAARVARDRHAFEQGERVVVHERAVLEAAGLALVGVGDDRLRPARRLAHRLPLRAGGEARAAAPGELAFGDLLDHAFR